jgi:hypothetical protein
MPRVWEVIRVGYVKTTCEPTGSDWRYLLDKIIKLSRLNLPKKLTQRWQYGVIFVQYPILISTGLLADIGEGWWFHIACELYIFFRGALAPSGPEPRHYRGFTITLWHTTLGRTPLDEWPARRRDLYLTTHNPQPPKQTDMLTAGGSRTRSPSKRAAAHPRLRSRGRWGRPI